MSNRRLRLRRRKAQSVVLTGGWISGPMMRDPMRQPEVEEEIEVLPPEVRYKKVSQNATDPWYATDGSAGFDLALAEGAVIQPGRIARMTTGLVIATPPGHMLYITFRSSTPGRLGITVLTGIVDEDYSGDDDVLKLQVWNFSQEPKRVEMGARIAQGIFVPVVRGNFVKVDQMGASRGGFGSTG